MLSAAYDSQCTPNPCFWCWVFTVITSADEYSQKMVQQWPSSENSQKSTSLALWSGQSVPVLHVWFFSLFPIFQALCGHFINIYAMELEVVCFYFKVAHGAAMVVGLWCNRHFCHIFQACSGCQWHRLPDTKWQSHRCILVTLNHQFWTNKAICWLKNCSEYFLILFLLVGPLVFVHLDLL